MMNFTFNYTVYNFEYLFDSWLYIGTETYDVYEDTVEDKTFLFKIVRVLSLLEELLESKLVCGWNILRKYNRDWKASTVPISLS